MALAVPVWLHLAGGERCRGPCMSHGPGLGSACWSPSLVNRVIWVLLVNYKFFILGTGDTRLWMGGVPRSGRPSVGPSRERVQCFWWGQVETASRDTNHVCPCHGSGWSRSGLSKGGGWRGLLILRPPAGAATQNCQARAWGDRRAPHSSSLGGLRRGSHA